MKWLALGASVLFLAASPARAGEVPVGTSAELTLAIGAAQPGDTLVLGAGKYALSGASCTAQATAAQPIVVKSAVPLAAEIEFDGLEGFKVSGAHWHFEGLVVRGVCANDDDCEHAFHVTGAAEGFVLRHSRVLDFNAQLKVNAEPSGNGWLAPHGGLVEYCEIADTAPRDTSNPVTKLNINNGDDWLVRGNYLHDFHKNGSNGVSYGAFMKGGSKNGIFERNLVACTKDLATGGTRIGLSFGGGGTAPQFCAPAFDANTPCNVEHEGGVMRNNLILSCSDVGVYLNRATATRILHNTLVATSGVDFRFDTTTGEALANLMMGKIRERDGGTFTGADNVTELLLDYFTALYVAPVGLDFTIAKDDPALQQAPVLPDVSDDYCARARPQENRAIGALEHSLGSCDVSPPPEGATSGAGGADAGETTGAGGAASGGASSAEGGGATSGAGGTGTGGGDASAEGTDGGCGCHAAGQRPPALTPWLLLAASLPIFGWRRRAVARAS